MPQEVDDAAPSRVMVLGGYGLIGAACCRALRADGFDVIAVGRNRTAAQRSGLDASWFFTDMARTSVEQWRDWLDGVSVVINASGALQDGAQDDLHGIHDTALRVLVEALEGRPTRLVQISAAGVGADALTEFMRSKARGDAHIMGSGLDWVILRPTLVIGADAYGGTALLRGAAAFPGVFPRVLPDACIQTVWVEDVAQAVVDAARGRVASDTLAELTEQGAWSLAEVQRRFRRWQGLPEWKYQIDLPRGLLAGIGYCADALGWLGWRSPLRTTALRSLESGVVGDASAWQRAGGRPCRSLDDTLRQIPSTVQERWFAHLFLLFPLVIGVLSVFWLVSGGIALLRLEVTAELLIERTVQPWLAWSAALGGAMLDLVLGGMVLYRRWARTACYAMIVTSFVYLVASLLIAPELWLDPLGPMVKVLPSIVLAWIGAVLVAER